MKTVSLSRFAAQAGLLCTLLLLPMHVSAIGILVPRLPEFAPIQLGKVEVNVGIRENVASTRVTQEFLNPNTRQLEADFYFPVPKGANVTDFVLYINGKPMKGEVLDKEKARDIYEGIVRRMQDPGLLEWVDYNLFKVRVFPVPPQGKQKIEIEFAQPLQADQGTFKYTFPLNPPRKAVASVQPLDVDFSVDLASADPIRNVYSPSHQISPDLKNPNMVRFKVPTSAFGPGTGDFLLFYELSRKEVALSLLTHRPSSDPGYFSLMISPSELPSRTAVSSQPSVPNDVTFVIDTSGSMLEDEKMEQARKALTYCVSQLRPEDRFNLVRFSTEVEPFQDRPQPATSDSISKAKTWITNLQARGGTNISGALEKALASRPDDLGTSRVYTIVFLTDGLPTVGITNPDQIIKATLPGADSRANVRIFTFGVGNDVNTKLLDRLADETRATSEYIRPKQDMEVPISRFFDKISRPAMTNLKLEIPGAEAFDLYPGELPDLFYGTQLTVFGRYKKAGPTAINLSGSVAGAGIKYTFEKTLPESEPENPFVEKLWGTRKIAYLLDQIRKSGENNELKNEVVALAKKYGVVTPYTSYLVTEDSPVQPLATPVSRRHDRADFSQPSGGRARLHPASPAPASEAAASPVARQGFSMAADSGAEAVTAAKAVREMKDARVAQPSRDNQSTRQAGGKTFQLRNETWVDSELENDQPTVRVRYLSDAWFQISRLTPKLREILGLGPQVRFKVAGSTLEVSATGADSIEDSLLKELRQNF